jgi:predicted dehydrogenase
MTGPLRGNEAGITAATTIGKRKLRLAIVGAGPGAFIGPVHLMASRLDDCFELCAGTFSRKAEASLAAGLSFGLHSERIYTDYRDMIAKEAVRPDGAEVIIVTTPNDTHFAISSAALDAGFHVMCDKPATLCLAEAKSLAAIVAHSGRQYGLSYTYSGYPMVREARAIVNSGRLGPIRKIVVEYPQGWLSRDVSGRQATWRADPAQAGLGGCVADIGVHAFQLAEYVSGLTVDALCADLGHVVTGRTLDDDCDVFLRFAGGARGALIASQISTGELNNLRLRVYGTLGSLDWHQETPTSLKLHFHDAPSEIRNAGAPYLSHSAKAATRLPAGHPEGYLEAFANLYRDFAGQITEQSHCIPGIADGVRGMAFIEAAVKSSETGSWLSLSEYVN